MAQHNPTFSDILQKTEREHSEKLMAKARLANNLAKRLRGGNRQTAYGVKTNALCSLVKSLPGKINISKDIKLTEFVVVELKSEQSGLHLPASKLV